MRITVRLIVSLVVIVAAVASVSAYIQMQAEKARQEEDLARRARLVGESLREAIEPLLATRQVEELQRLVERFGNRERLAGVAVYDAEGQPLAVTNSLSPVLRTTPKDVITALRIGTDGGRFDRIDGRPFHYYAQPLRGEKDSIGALAILHDAAYIREQLTAIWRYTFLRVLVQSVLIALVTLVVIRWSIVGPIARVAEWMKQLRAGEGGAPPAFAKGDLFSSITREAATFAKHLSRAEAAAAEEARLRHTAEALWTPQRLREHVRAKLKGMPLIVVSNREPYMHLRRGRRIECIVPAGGLVTALDPLLRACSGTWIAHGSGDADWEAADASGRIKVPPEDPMYTLKRVALTKEEETGYYYGFANEGLWPLCHIAHTRPVFRSEDWTFYQKANEKFAAGTLEEIEGLKAPHVLIQDYHLTLLPRLLKEKRPDARVAIFWHIPWPNPEAFGICPWQRELLMGMLGADLIGFHTQYHCNNFLDTVDRALESRIDWERFAVEKEGHSTLVKPFPISVEFPGALQGARPPDRASLLQALNVQAQFLGVGVERMDYTKGVLERFRAVERFLEKYPRYQRQFTFVQLGAPSRTHIKRYHDFLAEVEAEAERINWKFKASDWRPILFLKKHHSHEEILPFYQSADLSMVTSLHDGMNLVAKEFVASRADEDGVLILSRFTGASHELRDALIVNPYDTEQLADAIRYALEMAPEERTGRMRRMRKTVREHNIYRWAGTLIEALSQVSVNDDATLSRLESK